MKNKALEEAIVDTIIAAPLMFMLSTIIIVTCIDYINLEAWQASAVNFSLLTVVAVTRKYYIRLWYSKKNGV
jgi:hypothetical protein